MREDNILLTVNISHFTLMLIIQVSILMPVEKVPRKSHNFVHYRVYRNDMNFVIRRLQQILNCLGLRINSY